MTNSNNYCVIMAGGIGSRFWPYSRKSKPKQFLDFFGIGRTLLQQTFDAAVKANGVTLTDELKALMGIATAN